MSVEPFRARLVQQRGTVIESDDRLKEMLRLLVDHVEEYAIFLLDTSGHIASWNPGARRIKGYEADEIVGKHFSIFYPPDDQRQGKPGRALATAAEQGKFAEENWRVRKDGEQFWASILITPLRDDAGQLHGFAKITRDMTAWRRSEERLQEALRRAEAASRMKDEFLMTVSHELRTPLTSILGWASLLQLGHRDAEALELAIQSIEQNARLQARLVDDLLDVSRLTTGRLNVTFTQLDLEELLVQAVDAIRPTADAKGVSLRFEPCPELIVISGDPVRMHQVCWNLLANAVKFTDSGGDVRLRCVVEDGSAAIEVIDTGRGIDPAFLPRLFDRFSQFDPSSTRAAPGLGLGLAIARQLVEVHGGRIEASSGGEGTGSTFRVRLPILARSGRVAHRQDRPVVTLPSLAGLHVLIVEDDLHARTFLRALVEQCGAEVIPTGSVTEAMAALRQQAPDAVISDISLPGEDGFTFIRKLRAISPNVPAIAVTAVYIAPEDRDRLLREGFDAYLRKPVLPAELAERVRLLVSRPDQPPEEGE